MASLTAYTTGETITGNVWPIWCRTTATSNAVTYDPVWQRWVASYTGATTIAPGMVYVNGVWQNWVMLAPAANSYTILPNPAWAEPAPETPEQIAAREARNVEHRERERVQFARAALIRDRAKALLHRVLSAAQTKDLAENGGFFVFAPSGKLYRIYQGSHGNVDEIAPDGTPIARFCVQPSGVPAEDSMLAQMLFLLNQEEEFLRIANRSAPYGSDRGDNRRLAQLAAAALAQRAAIPPVIHGERAIVLAQ